MFQLNKRLYRRKVFKKSIPFSLKKIRLLSMLLFHNLYKYVENILFKVGQIHVFLKNPENILKTIFFLKYNCFFLCNQLLDFTIIDRIEMPIKENKRFEYIYIILSTYYNIRVFVRGFISFFEALPSLVSLFNSSNWLEREIWDLYGIFFIGHPDLRRILTDYGFSGFPFRKDFPLSGYVELRYDEVMKSIVMEPLELTQEFRYFKLENSWKNNYN